MSVSRRTVQSAAHASPAPQRPADIIVGIMEDAMAAVNRHRDSTGAGGVNISTIPIGGATRRRSSSTGLGTTTVSAVSPNPRRPSHQQDDVGFETIKPAKKPAKKPAVPVFTGHVKPATNWLSSTSSSAIRHAASANGRSAQGPARLTASRAAPTSRGAGARNTAAVASPAATHGSVPPPRPAPPSSGEWKVTAIVKKPAAVRRMERREPDDIQSAAMHRRRTDCEGLAPFAQAIHTAPDGAHHTMAWPPGSPTSADVRSRNSGSGGHPFADAPPPLNIE